MNSKSVRPTLESVTTINADGSRRFIHPASARGFFNRWRTAFALLLTAIYVALPWIQMNGNPALFLDVAHRQFHYFGLTFLGQDIWIGFFLLSGLGFCLFYITALLGRVWCGWACPQTVILDVARRIDRWCEGDATERRQWDRSRWTLEKTLRRSAKHALYLVFVLILAHILLSYFVSLPRLYAMMTQAPTQNWGAFLFVFLLSGALWFNIAWFREQFCIVLCPYGRLQSALIDSDSLVVGYDAARGEPRGRRHETPAGDCVDCLRCIQVCPTGIDIRQGLQMECVGCTACIDACDAVMIKTGRPTGLIRYDSARGFSGAATRWLRPRTILYTFLGLLGAIALTATTSTLKSANLSVTRVTGIPYVIEGGIVRNQFLVRILNKRNAPATFTLDFTGGPNHLQWTGAEQSVTVAPLGEEIRTVVLTLPVTDLKAELPLTLRAVSEGGTSLEKSVTFLGPIVP